MTEPESAAIFEAAADREATERAARAATPVVERVERASSLEPAARGALYALLSSLADNKYVLGRRYAEWCTGAPMLESAIAAAAMAQDELGHARSFYPLLRGFPEASEADTMEEKGWQNRPTSAMACLDRRFEAWSDFVAANLLVDTALTTLLEGATDSPYEPLRQRARKILQEEDAHWVHAEGWVRRLAADEQARPALVGSLERMWDDAFTWFGQTDDDGLEKLTRVGLVTSPPDALRERLRSRLGPVLEAADLAAALGARKLPWDAWDARARRLRRPT
jgi:ring-1,2-phenylacetyl-CoA epoxidase subunit PaaC